MTYSAKAYLFLLINRFKYTENFYFKTNSAVTSFKTSEFLSLKNFLVQIMMKKHGFITFFETKKKKN